MREIKFRGVHPNSRVVMDVCIIDWMHGEVYFEQGTDVSYPVDLCNLMQYTGLKDKNGVEIYEGDLIVDRDREQPVIVEYREDNCCFMLSSKSFVTKECANRFQYEVIGNIHQHPHLLEK